MSTEVKHSGAWRTLNGIEVKHSGAWRNIKTVEVKHGGTWRTVYSGLAVNLLPDGRTNVRLNSNCYGGAYFLTTGGQYEYNSSAGGVYMGSGWLLSGDAADVWIQWVRTGGTLSAWNSINPGTGRLQMTTHRYFRAVRGSAGVNSISGYFRAYDAASGGTLLDTGATGTYSQTYEFEGCPLCCFTPDTPITMASGLEMPIGSIREGDEILVKSPVDGSYHAEAVGEVLVRENREMWQITFEDGSTLRASADHPLHVEGKGYSSISPYDYKDLGIPEQLAVGDCITHRSGPSRKIVKLDRIEYPGAVFTFSNSFFFANGNLVY